VGEETAILTLVIIALLSGGWNGPKPEQQTTMRQTMTAV
jgi:hypothetical protein